MRGYWVKIALGALVIFAVGYTGIVAFRRTKQTVQNVTNGVGDITIPLPFVPFSLDAQRLGTFRRLVIHRDSPKHVRGIDVTVRLNDTSALTTLRNCQLTIDNPTRINDQTTFRCVAERGELKEFGEAEFEVKQPSGDWSTSLTVPVLLSEQGIREFGGAEADFTAEAARIKGERLRKLGDSLRTLGIKMGAAKDAAGRAEISRQMEEVQEAMQQDDISDLADSLSAAHEETAKDLSKDIEARVHASLKAKGLAPEPANAKAHPNR